MSEYKDESAITAPVPQPGDPPGSNRFLIELEFVQNLSNPSYLHCELSLLIVIFLNSLDIIFSS